MNSSECVELRTASYSVTHTARHMLSEGMGNVSRNNAYWLIKKRVTLELLDFIDKEMEKKWQINSSYVAKEHIPGVWRQLSCSEGFASWIGLAGRENSILPNGLWHQPGKMEKLCRPMFGIRRAIRWYHILRWMRHTAQNKWEHNFLSLVGTMPPKG